MSPIVPRTNRHLGSPYESSSDLEDSVLVHRFRTVSLLLRSSVLLEDISTFVKISPSFCSMADVLDASIDSVNEVLGR